MNYDQFDLIDLFGIQGCDPDICWNVYPDVLFIDLADDGNFCFPCEVKDASLTQFQQLSRQQFGLILKMDMKALRLFLGSRLEI